MFFSRDSRVIASRIAMPSVSGRWRSRITRSDGSRCQAARPAWPFDALVTVNPSADSASSATMRNVFSSSITNTVGFM